MAQATNLGFPRFGIKREWKKASEQYWRGKIGLDELLETADMLTRRHWKLQQAAGVDVIPCNDFAFYDLMLDTIVLLGAVPPRYGDYTTGEIDIDTYFAMARGRQDETTDVTAMEMTKWFDTNYHYIVPEFDRSTEFRLASRHPFRAVERARAAGVKNPRPVLIGPATFLLLGKLVEDGISKLDLVERLATVYTDILHEFHEMGIEWVQMDEPALVLDLDNDEQDLFRRVYASLTPLADRPKMMIATYFGTIEHNLDIAVSLGEGLHIDMVRAPQQLEAVLREIDDSSVLSMGIVNGRNVWRTDLDKALPVLESTARGLGGATRIQVAPSCSLLHSPIDLDYEEQLDPEIREWLAFGKQKLEEVHALAMALNGRRDEVEERFESNREALAKRDHSERVHNPTVRERLANVTEEMTRRASPFPARIKKQQAKLHLPAFPTTTIGSFPQTREVRRLRADLRKGTITQEQYDKAIADEITKTLRFQEEAGLDVLVHGEFERNDMVEYFGEQLEGYVFTKHGWVQSYGSRGVKPPIIFGDVFRPGPMTVQWSKFARDHTDRPLKGMLTGPVTMLQ
ncbi:5-methyltetrahydropteroyltriglutamate--homocysteine S-methyltransferase, partial [bacterium]|nr:5-methyltetrahydropteroyltriglutamate--homocysteine S-methyltransferase [bacterium]